MSLTNTLLVMLAALGLLGACSTDETAPRSDSSEMPLVADPDNPTQAELDAMADLCDAPRQVAVVVEGELQFRPKPDTSYDALACMLTLIRQSGITNFGFVGNEAYRKED